MDYLYPWGNAQQINLDWILQKIKELEAEIGGGGGGDVDLDDVANALISASYVRQAYDRSDIVFYNGKLYRANQAIPAPGEAWTPAHWDEILLGDTVSNIVQYVAALSNDQIVNNSSVSGTHTSDALDTLKTATDAAVTNVRYNSGYLKKTIGGADSNIIQIEDTPTDVSTKLPSSKAVYNATAAINNVQSTLSTLANAHYATLADESFTGDIRAQKYLHTIVISGSVNVGNDGIAGQLAVIATLSNQELPNPGTSSTVWGYGTYNGNVGFIQFELQANGNLRTRHGSGTITGIIRFPNATTFG